MLLYMNEQLYRQFLKPKLKPDSVTSYVSYLGRLERELHIDCDKADLSELGLRNIERRFAALGTAERSVKNCMSAARQYAALRGFR
jgi:hypothetical protein